MLDGQVFHITIKESNLQDLDAALQLFQQLHAKGFLFQIKAETKSKICLDVCHPKATGCIGYPLEVLLPMVKYKASNLEDIKDPYLGGDGTSIRAFRLYQEYGGLTLERTYLYAGK